MLGFLNRILSIAFVLLFSYQFIFIIVSLFTKERESSYEFSYHRFAVLICARNEEAVIADLLGSLDRQTYPKDSYKVFVMADGCSDATARIAGSNKAIVYERSNDALSGKGYALEELLRRVEEDYADTFDAFLVFDADNILKSDYLEQMNISYCKGNRIIAGYINSKNYGSNWISAGYSLYLLRKNRFLNQSRQLLGISSAINGTGFLFSREIIKHWPYHSLTEDIEFTVDQVCQRNRIAYCRKAVLFDEQPTSFRQSFYQRLRWSKGYLQVIRKYSARLISGIIEGDFSCFDMLNTILSAYGLSIASLLLNAASFVCLLLLKRSIVPFVHDLLTGLIRSYLLLLVVGSITVIAEWKNIMASAFNRIRYLFTFPLFLASYVPIALFALFAKVTWVPIRHGIRLDNEKIC